MQDSGIWCGKVQATDIPLKVKSRDFAYAQLTVGAQQNVLNRTKYLCQNS